LFCESIDVVFSVPLQRILLQKLLPLLLNNSCTVLPLLLNNSRQLVLLLLHTGLLVLVLVVLLLLVVPI